MRFPIKENAIKDTCCDGFPFGQNIVQKVCRFDLRGKSAGQVPSRLGDDDIDAVTVLFESGGPKRFGHDYHRGGWTQGWIEADVASPSGDGDAKVCIGVLVAYVISRHRLVEECWPFVFRDRDRRPIASADRRSRTRCWSGMKIRFP